ncbi:hypothetical protein CW304_29840 [Bacillus sp. UFRGS-B20]|nr:hypothetical protein CW304_29840 [Bacillus sp. UFRGS-B20]
MIRFYNELSDSFKAFTKILFPPTSFEDLPVFRRLLGPILERSVFSLRLVKVYRISHSRFFPSSLNLLDYTCRFE